MLGTRWPLAQGHFLPRWPPAPQWLVPAVGPRTTALWGTLCLPPRGAAGASTGPVLPPSPVPAPGARAEPTRPCPPVPPAPHARSGGSALQTSLRCPQRGPPLLLGTCPLRVLTPRCLRCASAIARPRHAQGHVVTMPRDVLSPCPALLDLAAGPLHDVAPTVPGDISPPCPDHAPPCVCAHAAGNKPDGTGRCAQPQDRGLVGVVEMWWDGSRGWRAALGGYRPLGKDRPGGIGGGLVLYGRQQLKSALRSAWGGWMRSQLSKKHLRDNGGPDQSQRVFTRESPASQT